MPTHLNKIGTGEFIDLVGTIEVGRERLELWERLGFEGHGARKCKKAGVPFGLVSILYVQSFTVAKTYYANARATIGSILAVTRNSENYGNYIIVDVKEHFPPQACFNAVGGLTAQQVTAGVTYNQLQVRQELLWTLVWNADPA